jgi:hypothetical protein
MPFEISKLFSNSVLKDRDKKLDPILEFINSGSAAHCLKVTLYDIRKMRDCVVMSRLREAFQTYKAYLLGLEAP